MTRAISLRSRVHRKRQARFWRPVERGDPSAEFNGEKPFGFSSVFVTMASRACDTWPSKPGFPRAACIVSSRRWSAETAHPESWLWETAEGRSGLTRLVVATLYTFGLKRGVGLDTISEFFVRLHLETQVGCSPVALRGVMQTLERRTPGDGSGLGARGHCRGRDARDHWGGG